MYFVYLFAWGAITKLFEPKYLIENNFYTKTLACRSLRRSQKVGKVFRAIKYFFIKISLFLPRSRKPLKSIALQSKKNAFFACTNGA